MYERKVNGRAGAGEHLTGNLDFYTITTDKAMSVAPLAANATDAQKAAYAIAADTAADVFDKVVEVISLNGQPIIMGVPALNELKFAIEHVEAWLDNDGEDALAAALLAHAQVVATVVRSGDL